LILTYQTYFNIFVNKMLLKRYSLIILICWLSHRKVWTLELISGKWNLNTFTCLRHYANPTPGLFFPISDVRTRDFPLICDLTLSHWIWIKTSPQATCTDWLSTFILCHYFEKFTTSL